MKQNLNTRKLLYSLAAVGAILGTSLVSGCATTQYNNGNSYNNDGHVATQIFTGILVGLGQGLSAL